MTGADVIQRLVTRGVELYVKDGCLRYQAEPGAYTDALRRLVATVRTEIITSLSPVPECNECRVALAGLMLVDDLCSRCALRRRDPAAFARRARGLL